MKASLRLFWQSILLIILISGCSHPNNPIQPSASDPLLSEHQSSSNQRSFIGFWSISIDPSSLSAFITPLRSSEMHLNVVKLLETAPCKTCLTINNLKVVEPNILEADLTLTHPYPGLLKYTGFDVRGIFISESNFTFPVSGRKVAWGADITTILNPDGYTSLFNPTEFPPITPSALGYIPGKKATGGDLSATINPFIAYRADAPRRMFESGGSETRTVRLHVPTGTIHFGYAVDVCWQLVEDVIDPLTDFPPSANCLEAYKIKVNLPSQLSSTPGSQTPVYVEVFDHQGLSTISSVTLESPDLFSGPISLVYSAQTSEESWLYTGTITNETGKVHGFYPLLAKVVDTESDQNLGNINAWQVASAGIETGWAKTWGGNDWDSCNSVAVDGSGNIYVTGIFRGDSVDFNPDPVEVDLHSSNGICDVFLSKYNSSGTFIWARTWGGSDADGSSGVAIDGSGKVLVTGNYSSTSVDFDPDLTSIDSHSLNGDYDVFLSKFDSSGNFMWARTWGGISIDYGYGLDVDDTGSACVVGMFDETVDFNPDPIAEDFHTSPNGQFDIFISKFDPSGTFVWARTWGGEACDEGYNICLDGSGNVYATGYFWGSVDFDPDPTLSDVHSAGDSCAVFLSKFDASGTFVWARTWGAEYGYDVDADDFGNVYVSGCFSGTSVDFNPDPTLVDPHTATDFVDIFLSKFDSSGTFQWARTWGGIDFNWGNGVKADGFGNAYVTGFFTGTSVDFDPDPTAVDLHSSNGHEDAFLSKFDSSGIYQWARTWGTPDDIGPDGDDALGIDVGSSGVVYVTGNFSSTADFNPDPIDVDLHTSNGEHDAFLSKFLPDGYW